MAILTIQTYLNEAQMSTILDNLICFINKNKNRIGFVDFEFERDNVQVQAGFSTICGNIAISPDNSFTNGLFAEVFLNGDTLFYDSVVFQQRLQALLSDINRSDSEAKEQALDIFSDRQTLFSVC